MCRLECGLTTIPAPDTKRRIHAVRGCLCDGEREREIERERVRERLEKIPTYPVATMVSTPRDPRPVLAYEDTWSRVSTMLQYVVIVTNSILISAVKDRTYCVPMGNKFTQTRTAIPNNGWHFVRIMCWR